MAQEQSEAMAADPDTRGVAVRNIQEDLTEITKAADRASLLTAQLLAFSRRQQVSVVTLNVVSVVRDLERMLQRLIGVSVQLDTRFSSDVLPVRADGGQFAQIIVNLVVNARDAMPQGGRITIEAHALDLGAPSSAPFEGLAAGAWVILSVQDDGVGMSPEVQARIFEPFFTTKPVGRGTGLGLSTVYGIVKQGDGELFVDSQLGVGTRVTVAWPRCTVSEAPVDVPAVEQRGGDGDLVLVAEDEPGLRRLVGEILKRRGYRIAVAEDGVDALAQIDAGLHPALVLTDVVMPRMGGRELAEAVRARSPALPVLFMSGYPAGEALPEDASHAFIAKPFTPDGLADAVRKALLTAAGTGVAVGR